MPIFLFSFESPAIITIIIIIIHSSSNLGTTRLRGRPRNRWQDGVREDGRIVGGEGWQETVHNREEWKNSWWGRVAGDST